jgi:DNA-directed RNA polymerase subunit H (RpoH/RPB5)
MTEEAENDDTQLITQHLVDHEHHRFQSVTFRGTHWDLSHLSPFVFKVAIENNRHVIVVILFSCHCFTHAVKNDTREEQAIPKEELYHNQQETRVLNEERYLLSKTQLPKIMAQLHQRHITVADEGKRGNFVTIELINQVGEKRYYGVFFEVSKDKKRGGRIILRVQSAYLLNGLTKRQKAAKKVRFEVLIKAEYEGRKIRP